jgi:tRNA(Ile)-lysidine synthase
MHLSTQLATFVTRHDLVNTPGVVAVSGGPDSIALVHLLRDINPPLQLTLAHVNHQLRGDESDADEAFVQTLAESLSVNCKTTRIDVRSIAERERDNLEGIARRERYAWLEQIARETGASWIATGHTADDQAETVLFRLLRGSGVLGLRGIAEIRPLDGVKLVRPLLALRRQAIHDYLQERKLAFRVDSSNLDLTFTRNRLRLELLPHLEQNHNPAIVDVLCRLADQAQELAAEIEVQVERLLSEAEKPRAGNILVFVLAPLQAATANLVRELFRHVWRREGWPMSDMDHEHWQRLVEIVRGAESECDYPAGIRVRRVGKVLQIHGPV